MTKLRRFLLVLMVLAVLPGRPAFGYDQEQAKGDCVARLHLDAETVGLADDLRLTLSVDGPAPLRVMIPGPLSLTPAWQARALGAARMEALPDGKERWTQTYRLRPYQAGDAVMLSLEELQVRAGPPPRPQIAIAFAALPLRVTTALDPSNPGPPRPVTPIEELPPVPSADRGSLLLPVGVALAVVLGLLLLMRWARRRAQARLVPLSAGAWAIRELGRLETAKADPAVRLGRLADVLRQYLRRRFDVPADRRTSAELLVDLERKNVLPPDQVGPLRDLLERCDEAKFAPSLPTDEGGRTVLALARQWVEGAEAPSESE